VRKKALAATAPERMRIPEVLTRADMGADYAPEAGRV
jgi:hypothetical protein